MDIPGTFFLALSAAQLFVIVGLISAWRTTSTDALEGFLQEFHTAADDFLESPQEIPESYILAFDAMYRSVFDPQSPDNVRRIFRKHRMASKSDWRSERPGPKLSRRAHRDWNRMLEAYIQIMASRDLVSGFRLRMEMRRRWVKNGDLDRPRLHKAVLQHLGSVKAA